MESTLVLSFWTRSQFSHGDNEIWKRKQEVSIHLFPLRSPALHSSVHNESCYRLPATYCYSSVPVQSQLAQHRQPSLVFSAKIFSLCCSRWGSLTKQVPSLLLALLWSRQPTTKVWYQTRGSVVTYTSAAETAGSIWTNLIYYIKSLTQ